MLIFEVDEAGIDHVGVPVAPVEGFEIVAELLLAGPGELILVDF